MERIKQSPNWRDGKFHNLDAYDPNEPGWLPYSVSLMTRGGDTRPDCPIPFVKTDLKSLDRDKDCVVWFGHASIFLQIGGKRYLMDPVLSTNWAQNTILRPFKGTSGYSPEDIPEVDVFLITHNHWDHLDYFTVIALMDRVGVFVCPLGVGEYLEYWGCPKEKIVELDWGDSYLLGDDAVLHSLSARHNSRRFAAQDKTLWMAAFIESPSAKHLKGVFISGDGGYSMHFSEVREKYGEIDLAIMENGQYPEGLNSVHSRPEELVQEIEDLSPKMVLPYHNSKYALSTHPWFEPQDLIYENSKEKDYILLSPMIGEMVDFGSSYLPNKAWWRELDCYPHD